MTGADRCVIDIRLVSPAQWRARALNVMDSGIPRFTVESPGRESTVIEGVLTRHQNVFVLGFDWLPIMHDGTTVLDGMIHTPELFLKKSRRIQLEGDSHRAMLGSVRSLADPVFLIGGSPNYYHWLVIHLPRLLIWIDEIKKMSNAWIAVNSDLSAFQVESLQALGISPSRLLPVGDMETIDAADVWIPSLLSANTVAAPMVPKLLRKHFQGGRQGGPKLRIYLSRGDASSRRITNEDELIDLLKCHGFLVIETSRMTFAAQVDLFSKCEVLISPHGAGMTNMVFCQPGAEILEIYSPIHKVTSMRLLARVCKLKHHFIPAHNASFGADGNPLLGDWTADLVAVQSALLGLAQRNQ